jgi:hypothetical protein
MPILSTTSCTCDRHGHGWPSELTELQAWAVVRSESDRRFGFPTAAARDHNSGELVTRRERCHGHGHGDGHCDRHDCPGQQRFGVKNESFSSSRVHSTSSLKLASLPANPAGFKYTPRSRDELVGLSSHVFRIHDLTFVFKVFYSHRKKVQKRTGQISSQGRLIDAFHVSQRRRCLQPCCYNSRCNNNDHEKVIRRTESAIQRHRRKPQSALGNLVYWQ